VSTLGLLAMGVVVTLLTGCGLALLVYGAILDGRDDARRAQAEVRELSDRRPGHRPAA